ncbi:MAG: hypothetical protein R3245_10615 [Kiloniellales bacterium]|nr:hypothetical protein [Kiloniellales bacterium]
MVNSLPIDHQGIVRAAEEMITEFGEEALAKAKKRAQKLRSEGFESVASTWDLICEVIRDQQNSGDKPQAYKSALQSNIFLSE